MWKFNSTAEYVDCCEKLNLSSVITEAIKRWAVSVGRISTNKQKRYFCSPRNVFEIWTARIPDPDTNTGSSGGFRLVYFLNISDGSVYVDRIERRSNLGGKNERPRDQQRFTEYLENLKVYLLRELDGNAA